MLLNLSIRYGLLAGACMSCCPSLAAEVVSEPTSSFISVGNRLLSMDKNHDGMVSVYEVRSFIEDAHGKQYKQDVLDDMESSANGKSCSTPFAKPLY